jgi:hypothetical protein
MYYEFKYYEAPRRRAHSLGQISVETSLSQPFLRKEIKHGNLVARKFGRRIVVLDEDLRRYLNRDTVS